MLRAAVLDERVRFGFACVVAFSWYVAGILGEAGQNAAPAVVIGVPAALVVIWWRVRPTRALVLSAVALLLVPIIAMSSGRSALILASTGWFAVLGASASFDRRLRWAGAGLAAADVLVVLVATFGYGSEFLFVFAAFSMAVAVGLGWLWRQSRVSTALRERLEVTTARSEAAERDILLELERNRIAREVHDVVAHSLAVVIAQADGARFAAEARPESVAPALEAISDTARRALGEVRTMLHDLRTSGEGAVIPGPDDLAGLVEGIRALDVHVEDATFGEPGRLDERSGLALYRIAQEALTNAMRHGDRSEPVGFELDWGAREVVLVVTNAVPMDAVPASERAGHGVTGMLERAADADGDCSAGIGSNGRYRVRVALPVVRGTGSEPAPDATTRTDSLAELFAPLTVHRA